MMKLGKPDPEGYYIIIAKKEAKNIIINKYKGIIIENHGKEIIIKTKSRSTGKQILRKLSQLKLIANPYHKKTW